MTSDRWTAVDEYLVEHIGVGDETLAAAVRASDQAGLPAIQVTPTQGKLIHLLARSRDAKAILELGTLGGYSTIWLARALAPGGRVVTLEYEPKHAEVARANLARAGVADRVDLRVGAALETLPKLAAEGLRFDLTFIDADKVSTVDYFNWALDHSHAGSLIIVDNVVRDGAVIDPKGNSMVQGVRKLFDALSKDDRISATAVQTVGDKGYDGFLMAVVL